jgi:hypothetical protein
MRAVALLVVVLVGVGSGCATTHMSPARFVSRAPTGGVVATPRADIGMDDANEMIAAHCGAGGYAITREGEALVGDTVVTEGASSVEAQTTEGGGQVQGHEASKTVFATGSDWQVHYACNDPRTVNMGLITRSRTVPSRFAWGADAGAGVMMIAGHEATVQTYYGEPRSGSATTMGANAWLGYKLSDKLALGGGLGITQVLGMPQWTRMYDSASQGDVIVSTNQDAAALEIFATATYGMAPKLDLRLRIGIASWNDVDADGAVPFASVQLGYRIIDVGPDSGVYLSGGVGSYFSSSLTSNVSPAVLLGFH